MLNVLLIPGFMLDQSMWDDLITYLPATWKIQTVDLAGGSSIQSIAQHITENAPDSFVLIGFSLGGYIAREIAGRYPERVSALIIIASSLREDTALQITRKQEMVRAVSVSTFSGFSQNIIAKSLHPARSKDLQLINKIREMGVHLGYKSLVTQSALRRDLIPTTNIQCPTLVIAGADDKLRSLEESIEIQTNIQNSVLDIIEDTGHMIPMEEPERLANSICTWLINKS